MPAHTVIISGTQVYDPSNARWQELCFLDVLQMVGRAGRPQYDSFGEGVIISDQITLHMYVTMLNQQFAVESKLLVRVADCLNSEMVLGRVCSVRGASH